MQNTPLRRNGSSVSDLLSTQIKNCGGVSDNEVTAFIVNPYNLPSVSAVVTMETPLAQ